jgi:hypothetical protein
MFTHYVKEKRIEGLGMATALEEGFCHVANNASPYDILKTL